MMPNDSIDNDTDEPKSKSQLKREMQELQDIGVRLTHLTETVLHTLPLEPQLLDCVLESKHITEKSGKKRHLQFIGKLMRHADSEAIRDALEKMDESKKTAARQLHTIERWRDRLLNDGAEALSAFFVEYPQADRQQIRNILRAAKKEIEQKKSPTNTRKLFKALRDTIH